MGNFWQGNAIRLRAVEPEDWKYFIEWDKDIRFSQFTDDLLFPDSSDRVKRWVAELTLAEPWKHDFRMMIESVEGGCVGTLNSHTCDPRAGTFQYGIYIEQQHRCKGYGTEAVRLLLAYFFHELRYQKVNVTIHAFNEDSIQFHRKLGFFEEGRLRQMIFSNGRYYDEIILGMTIEEFNRSLEQGEA